MTSQKSSSLIPQKSLKVSKHFFGNSPTYRLQGNAFVTLDFSVTNFMCSVGCCTSNTELNIRKVIRSRNVRAHNGNFPADPRICNDQKTECSSCSFLLPLPSGPLKEEGPPAKCRGAPKIRAAVRKNSACRDR